MRWTISQKILIGFGLSWLAIVFIGFTGYGITTTLIDYSRQTEHTQQVHDTIHLLREDLVTLEASLYRFVITGDNRFLQPVQPHFTSPAGHLQTLHTLTVNDSHHKEVQARLDTLESAVQQYLTQIAMLEATPPDERIEAARTLVASGPYQTTMREIDGILTTLDEEETTALTTQTTRNRWLSDSAGLLIGLTVVFALAFTVLGGIGLINRISRATTELMRGAREFSLGHLDYRIPSPSHDEMAALAHAYNQMAERLATTQTELHQSNTFFQQLFASSPDAILIINSQGKITHANHTATRLYGYTLAELIELSPKDLVPPRYYEAHSQCTEKYLANPFQHGLVDQQNLFAYTKDGREIPVNILLQTLELEDETLLLCVARDISAQKQAEADLRTQAEQIYDLYNQAPCGYHSVDAEGVFVAINDTELQWLGYAREEIIGKKRNYDLLTPASQKTYWETFERFKESGVIQGLELEYLRADGSILPVILNATAALDTQGNFQMSRATLFDVTELNKTRKALEQVNADLEARVEQRTAELTRSEREFRALAENSLVGIFRTNLKGKVLYANEAMVRILEYPSLAEASNPSAFSHFRDSGDEQAVYTRLQRQRAVENYETDILTYHGKIRTILLSLTLDRTIISGMAIDVTIRKQAEARLQEYNRRMSFLAEASRVFSEASMDYNSVAEQIARHLSEAFGDLCFIRLLSDQQVWENLTAFYDPDPVLREVIQTMMETLAPEALFASLSSQALKTSTPVLIEETLAESLKPIINPTHWALLDRFHKFSLMIIPMHYRKRVIGLVYFFRHTAARRPYTSGDLNLVSELAERAALAITNARLFELVQQELTQKALSANEALRFNAILEQRVEERTAQLAEINFELQTEIYERKQLEEQIRQNVARAQALA
ncbi:MAG TPA: PAS domain S-box protein, partial [Anaerolineales bacterium]|nr:PAS domain S-box protein [Anaerolineales bacterium]